MLTETQIADSGEVACPNINVGVEDFSVKMYENLELTKVMIVDLYEVFEVAANI